MTALTWENVDAILAQDDGEEQYEELCAKSVASDFYVAINDQPELDDDGKLVYIAPRAYFDDNDCMFDQHMSIDHLLPDYIAGNDEMEGVWFAETNKSYRDILQDLTVLGFATSKAFSQLVNEICDANDTDDEDNDYEYDE